MYLAFNRNLLFVIRVFNKRFKNVLGEQMISRLLFGLSIWDIQEFLANIQIVTLQNISYHQSCSFNQNWLMQSTLQSLGMKESVSLTTRYNLYYCKKLDNVHVNLSRVERNYRHHHGASLGPWQLVHICMLCVVSGRAPSEFIVSTQGNVWMKAPLCNHRAPVLLAPALLINLGLTIEEKTGCSKRKPNPPTSSILPARRAPFSTE